MIKTVLTIFSMGVLSSCFGQSETVATDSVVSETIVKEVVQPSKIAPVELNAFYLEVVDTSALKLQNDTFLYPFFERLHALENQQTQKVRIAHIGDSHIQADFLTKGVRQHFQRDFGNGGRGLIFPYKIAKTNGPLDFAITTDVDWKAKRNVFPQQPMEIGVSGITIGTEKPHYHLQIRIDSNDFMDSLVIFHEGASTNPFTLYTTEDHHLVEKHSTVTQTKYHKIQPGESLSVIASKYNVTSGQLQRWNGLRSSRIYAGKSLKILSIAKQPRPIGKDEMQQVSSSVDYSPSKASFRLPSPHYQVVVEYQGNPHHKINGIYVEKSTPGVVYNMIGVNGAKYEHYNKSKNFQAQFKYLNNDLIIVALGTNESLEHGYDSLRLANEFNQFISDLQKNNPEATFLISLNPDAYSRRKQNPNAARLNRILQSLCNHYQLAYFDAFQLMGGQGGMYKWYQQGLANRDLVHLNARGYEFMADLLYTAIINSYIDYQTHVGNH